MGSSGPKVAEGVKIGGDFTVTKGAAFLKERAAIFDSIKVPGCTRSSGGGGGWVLENKGVYLRLGCTVICIQKTVVLSLFAALTLN